MAAIRDDLALARGFKRRRKRGGGGAGGRGRKGPRERRHPPEIARQLGEAAAHYASLEVDQAIPILREIIRTDATVWEAWVTLAQCHEDRGEPNKALGCRLVAAHLRQDKDNWFELAETSARQGQVDQSLYCYRRAARMDATDANVLYAYASALKAHGKDAEALEAFKKLLALSPHDLLVLAETPPLFLATNQVQEAVQLYSEAFDWHMNAYSDPDAAEMALGLAALSLDTVTTLADLLFVARDYDAIVDVCRRGQRWFQGRRDETFWDAMTDDREYDPPNAGEREGEGYELDLNLRHRLAVARLKLGHDADADVHIAEILRQDPATYAVLWADVGVALMDRGRHEYAMQIFERLVEDGGETDVAYVTNLGLCQLAMKDPQAIETLRAVLEVAPDRAIQLKLAEALENAERYQEALEVIQGVIGETKEPQEAVAPSKKKSKSSEDSVPDVHALELCESAALAGDASATRSYTSVASRMISRFRRAKSLYPVDRSRKYRPRDLAEQAEELESRLQEPRLVERTKDSFEGVNAETWLRVVIQHACLLMRDGNALEASEILLHVSLSNMFSTERFELPLRLASLAAAMRLQDYTAILDASRAFIREAQFKHEPFQLLSAALGPGLRAVDTFGNLHLQKFLLREMRAWDHAADGRELHWNDKIARWVVAGASQEAERHKPTDLPTKRSPLIYATYGQVMLVAKSYQSAIYYLLKAFELDPYDPMICLNLAQAYIGRAMVRQVDNRLHAITTASAFLVRYRKLGGDDPCVDYNFARAFHGLGIFREAIPLYQRALEGPLRKEAAYNLHLIFLLTGGTALAQDMAEILAL